MPKKFDLKLKGTVGGWNFDPEYVDYILDKNNKSAITVLIDSLGGSVASALSIVASFKNHGNVTVHFVGMNASAATIASLGAAHISIDSSAMYLVHQCSQLVFEWASMNADQLSVKIAELEQQKKDLEKIDLNLATMYSAKCKHDKKALQDLMKVGGWLTAEEALDWGFVDEITDDPEDNAPEITDSLIASLVSNNIPIPPVARRSEESSLVNRILSSIINLVSPKNIKHTMNKIFALICGLLTVEAITLEDGKATLTEDQLQTIEDALSAKNKSIQELNATIAERDTTIKNLNESAAASTTQVIAAKKPDDNADSTPIGQFVNSMSEAKKLYDNI